MDKAICNFLLLGKNLLTRYEKKEENQLIDWYNKPFNPIGKFEKEKLKDEDNYLIDLLLVKNLLTW